MELKDKVIIITGGCQGLGRAMGEYLAAKGAKLALVDLNQEKLDEAVAACTDSWGQMTRVSPAARSIPRAYIAAPVMNSRELEFACSSVHVGIPLSWG